MEAEVDDVRGVFFFFSLSKRGEAWRPLHADRQPHWSPFTHEKVHRPPVVHHVMNLYRTCSKNQFL